MCLSFLHKILLKILSFLLSFKLLPFKNKISFSINKILLINYFFLQANNSLMLLYSFIRAFLPLQFYSLIKIFLSFDKILFLIILIVYFSAFKVSLELFHNISIMLQLIKYEKIYFSCKFIMFSFHLGCLDW